MRPLVVVGSALLILMLNIITVGQMLSMESEYEKSYKSRSAILLTEKILSTLKDAETGERGYVISGKPEFLQPFNMAKEHLRSQLEEVKEYESLQAEKFARIKKLCEEQMIALENIIEKVKKGQVEEAEKMITEGDNKARMDSIRVITGETQTAIRDKHIRDRETVLALFSYSKVMMFLNAIAGLALVVLLVWHVIQFVSPNVYG